MSLTDLKDDFLRHQRRDAHLWQVGDTKDSLASARRNDGVRRGIDPRLIKSPEKTTVDTYHSALMADPSITDRIGTDKAFH